MEKKILGCLKALLNTRLLSIYSKNILLNYNAQTPTRSAAHQMTYKPLLLFSISTYIHISQHIYPSMTNFYAPSREARIIPAQSDQLIQPFTIIDLQEVTKCCPSHNNPGLHGIPYQLLTFLFRHDAINAIAAKSTMTPSFVAVSLLVGKQPV